MPSRSLACFLCLLSALTLAAVLALSATPARAAWPPDESKGPINYADPANQPNDPGFAGQWNYWSFVPKAWQPHVTEQNKKLGTGAHVDRAFARTIGDRRVLISVIDSGSDWSSDGLVNKWHLNDGELPAPTGCPGADGMRHDTNGDGYFNVQDYTTAKGHELPSFDKVCDPRVLAKGDVNKNGILDPQDLIATFSDGKDDDKNGYVDDISGWDFFRNDNDPFDDTGYGHGNGEANDSAAEGNDGRGGIGTCPECSVQLLRGGDSFTGDDSDFGLAAMYAVDSGSAVIQVAEGNLDNTPLSRAGKDYAYANNVAIIASAADEDSFHHNFPGTGDHTYVVHAITHDASSPENSTTFLNFNNCTNYGAQLAASVPGGACSSATGRGSGMVGLIYAAALAADIPAPPAGHNGDPHGNRRLRAEEVYQILRNGIDDLYDPADAADPTRYPTRVGFEARFGYGRVNARNNVDQVLAGRIPPETEIRSPSWFEVVYPERTPKLVIDGRVQFRNRDGDRFGETVDYVLEWAPGIEPDDNAWKPIAKEQDAQGLDGALGTWDLSTVHVDNPTQGPPDNQVNRYMVTLRLRATVHSSVKAHEGAYGETRRAFFVHRDPDLLPGFPIRLGASGESSPKIVDLLGDGKREIVVGDSSGALHAYRPDGTELPGFPVHTRLLPGLDPTLGASHAGEAAFTTGPKPYAPDFHAAILASPAIGDIDGDKKPEIFVADYEGNLYAFHGDGTLVKGWPQEVDRSIVAERGKRRHPAAVDDGVFASPAMADFDGDGVNEIVVADMLGEVTVWKGNGTKMAGWPVRVWDTARPDDEHADQPRQLNRIMSSPALGDLNADGIPDIVVGTNETYDNQGRLYALDGKTGAVLPGFPVSVISVYILPVVGSGIPNAPALADLDGDKIPEIVVAGIGQAVRIYDHTGKSFGRVLPNTGSGYGKSSNAMDPNTFSFISNPAIGDLDDDGVLDVAYPTVGEGALLAMATGGMRKNFELHLSVWNSKTGNFLPGFPQVMEDYQFFNNPVLADIDGDGHSEIIEGSAGYFLHAFRADGSEANGFPKFTGQWIAATAAVGDMDGDGKLELAVGTRDGWLYAWHTAGKRDGRIDWESFHHDPRNTGNYDVKLDQGTRVVAPGPGSMMTAPKDSGCGCRMGGAGGGDGEGRGVASSLAALAMALVVLGGARLVRGRRRPE